MSSVEALFSEYVDRTLAGEEPDPDALIERAGADGKRLIAMIEHFQATAPALEGAAGALPAHQPDRTTLQASLEGAGEAGDHAGVAAAATELAIQAEDEDRLDDARDRLADVREAFEAVGDLDGALAASVNLGRVLELTERLSDALEVHDRAVEISRQLGRPHEEGAALLRRGQLLGRLGRPDEAKEALEAALQSFEVVGDAELLKLARERVEGLRAGLTGAGGHAGTQLPGLAELWSMSLDRVRELVAQLPVPVELQLARPSGALRGPRGETAESADLKFEVGSRVAGVPDEARDRRAQGLGLLLLERVVCRCYIERGRLMLRFEGLPNALKGQRIFILVRGADAPKAPRVDWSSDRAGLLFPDEAVGEGSLTVDAGAIDPENGDLRALLDGMTVMSERGNNEPEIMFSLSAPER